METKELAKKTDIKIYLLCNTAVSSKTDFLLNTCVHKLSENFFITSKFCIALADMQMTHPLCINWFSLVPFAALYWFLNS
jgi:hypothetical protein